MAEKFLEPQNPLKKIDETTGDVTYVYPLTTDKQVIMENGERLSTVLKENILYMGETAEESTAEVIRADTLGGYLPEYYATAEAVETAQNAAETAQSTANSAKTTADNAMPKSGGTFTGDAVAYSTNRTGASLRNINVVDADWTSQSTNAIFMVRK